MTNIKGYAANKKSSRTKVRIPNTGETFILSTEDYFPEDALVYLYLFNQQFYYVDPSGFTDFDEIINNEMNQIRGYRLYRAKLDSGEEIIYPIDEQSLNSSNVKEIIAECEAGNWVKKVSKNEFKIALSNKGAHFEEMDEEQISTHINEAFDGFIIDNDQHPLIKEVLSIKY